MPEHGPRAGEQVVHLDDQLRAYARDLRAALERSQRVTDELSRTHLETVAALAAAVDVRDEVTGGHVYRVAHYGVLLAARVAPELTADPQLVYGFLLHDIGKLGVPDRVLMKAGPLDEEEVALMRQHVEYGVRFVEQVAFLRPALQVVATHHEMWDGSGYPRGLRTEEIPLATRMFAVCDAFDAMIHDRPYRRAMEPDRAVALLRSGAGRQWDPEVVAAFESALDAILAVEERPEVPAVPVRIGPRHRREVALGGHLFDAIDEGLLLVSPEGVIQDTNTTFLEMFGLTRPPVGMVLEEFVERTGDRFADRELARRRSVSLPRELFSSRSETRFDLVAPRPRTVHRVAHTLYGDDGEVLGRLLVFRDVSAEARLERASADASSALGEVLAALDHGDPTAARRAVEAAAAALRPPAPPSV